MKTTRSMVAGPLIGVLGGALFLASLLIRDKRYEVTQLVLGLAAMCILGVATVLIGLQKHRPWFGVGLALLSPLYGLGFIVILLVPEKVGRDAEPATSPNGGPAGVLGNSGAGGGPPSVS